MLPPMTLSHLYEILKNLNEKKFVQEQEIWSLVLEKSCELLGTEMGVFFSWDPKSRQLLPLCSREPPTGKIPPNPFNIIVKVCDWVAQNKQTALVQDTSRDPRFDKNSHSPSQTILAVPIYRNEDLLGVLEVTHPKKATFTPEDQELLEFLGSHTSLLSHSLRMQQALGRVTAHNASILENLTGGFIGIDLQGNVMILNPRARQILEIHEENVVGKPIESVLKDCPGLSLLLKESLARSHPVKRQELPWTYKGERRLLGYSTLLIQDVHGGIAGAGATFQDLTKL
ncbi:MAG: GAF domain-containing protein [Elusimicrobia bacterium]|nr:GAF domain-containing protein [Elusimicrobiota bacterium]